jgi:hypothetical protein
MASVRVHLDVDESVVDSLAAPKRCLRQVPACGGGRTRKQGPACGPCLF